MDLDLVDHIEVVRGPGSSLFGTNAIFGVINVITRQPERKAEAETSGRCGIAAEPDGQRDADRRPGPRFGAGFRQHVSQCRRAQLFFPVFASPGTNNGYAENADGSHFEHAFAELRDGDFTVDGMLSDRIRQFPTGADRQRFDDPADRDNDARGYVDADLHRKLSVNTDLEVRAYYDAYDYVGSGDYAAPGYRADGRLREDARGLGGDRSDGDPADRGADDYDRRRVRIQPRPQAVDLCRRTARRFLVGSRRRGWPGHSREAELHLIPRLIVHAGARVDKLERTSTMR